MSKPYDKNCIFCQKKLRMSDQTGKWLPYNEDGSIHDCKKNGTPVQKSKQEITLEQVQKKLASIGIILNVERLMKE